MPYGFETKEDFERVANATKRIEGLGSTAKNIRRQKPVGLGGGMVVLRLIQVFDDHLICRRLEDIDDSEEDIKVIKSETTRKSAFDGKTIDGKSFSYSSRNVRIVDDGEDAEQQEIIPPYVEKDSSYDGSEIIAAKVNVDDIDVSDDVKEDASHIEVTNRNWGRIEEE